MMKTRLSAAALAAAAGLTCALAGFGAAAEPLAPQALSDSQLDTVAAGGARAKADGTGTADGAAAQSSAGVVSYSHGLVNGGAAGQVSASATAAAGALATASSTLSLSVTF